MDLSLFKPGEPGRYRRIYTSLIFIFIAIFSATLKAQVDLNKGYLWLSQQQAVTGGFSSDSSIAEDIQVTSAALQALTQANQNSLINYSLAVEYLAKGDISNTQGLSRLLMAGVQDAAQQVSYMNDLLARQNADGGFGFQQGYDSSVLDTSYALLTLSVLQFDDSVVLAKALGYLVGQQTSGGGFFLTDGNQPSVYLTALASKALQGYLFKYQVGEAIDLASHFLISSQAVSGGWGELWLTSIALQAVIPVVTDTTLYVDALDFLAASQMESGAWQSDVYVTALALNALYLAQNIKFPVDPNSGALTATIVDGASQLGLAGVTISLTGSGNLQFSSDQDGLFRGENIPPGSYRVTYEAYGYASASQSVQLQAGQLISLGKVSLSPVPTEGVVYGIVTDGKTGLPLSGVTLNVDGIEQKTLVSGEDGSYRVSIKEGGTTISASLDGYQTASAATSIVAGTSIRFSPALFETGSAPNNPFASISGQVIDADTKHALSFVDIRIQDSDSSAQTDGDGRFSLQTEAGEVVLSFSLDGYTPVYIKMLAPQGNTLEIGAIPLTKSVLGDFSSVYGIVVDEQTGKPIPGAKVSVEGMDISQRANGGGIYDLVNIDTLTFDLFVQATGYMSSRVSLSLASHERVQQNIKLSSAATGQVDISYLQSDQNSYDAYQPVAISFGLNNSGVDGKNVRAVTEILDNKDQVLNTQSMSSLSGDLDTQSLITLLPEQSTDLTDSWFTGNHAPGTYSVRVKVYDGLSNNLLAERRNYFDIRETSQISQLKITPKPLFSYVGETTQVTLNGIIENRSNVSVPVKLGYNFLHADGSVIHSGLLEFQLEPGELNKAISMAQFEHLFEQKGAYQTTFELLSDTQAQQSSVRPVTVSPTTRLEVSQDILPKVVIPSGNKTVSVQIRLQGVEQ